MIKIFKNVFSNVFRSVFGDGSEKIVTGDPLDDYLPVISYGLRWSSAPTDSQRMMYIVSNGLIN